MLVRAPASAAITSDTRPTRPETPASSTTRSDRDPRRHAPETLLGESTNLRLVRLRLFLALVTMFAIPIAIAAPVVYGLAWGSATSLVVPTLGLVAAGRRPRLAHGLAGPPRPRARRAPRGRPRILEDAYDRARAEALRDALTGLGNHRAFQEELERQWAGATRHGQPLALALLDLDDFKRINDAAATPSATGCSARRPRR